MPLVRCMVCGGEFTTLTTGKLCSVECRRKNKSSTNAKYHATNRDTVNSKSRIRYVENREYYKDRDKKKRLKEKEERVLSGSVVRTRNDYSNLSEEEKRLRQKESINRQKRERYQQDAIYALQIRIRALLNGVLRKNGLKKSETTEQYLGCDYETFRSHIESTFKTGMSWENRQFWHIDHIIPISNARSAEEVKRLSNYRNLHAMWADQNIKKSNKLGFSDVSGIMIKTYAEKGDYEQFRNESTVVFNCLRCGREKKSKLVVVYKGNWQKIICNGCYGALLSKGQS